MARSLTSKNLLDKKPGKNVEIINPDLKRLIGDAGRSGCWLIYGSEKNGKTWFALKLAKELAKSEKVSYISAEEGTEDSFIAAATRAGITSKDRILWDDYISLEDLVGKFKKPKSPNIIFIDNLMIYEDEIRPGRLKSDLIDKFPDKLFILIAHEERKEAYPAVARKAKKIAKVIINVKGLRGFITSRYSSGGEVTIDYTKSDMCWGTNNE